MIGFNSYNMYTIFQGAPAYGESSIFSDLGNHVGAFLKIPICVRFFIAHSYFLMYYIVMRFVVFVFVVLIFINL